MDRDEKIAVIVSATMGRENALSQPMAWYVSNAVAAVDGHWKDLTPPAPPKFHVIGYAQKWKHLHGGAVEYDVFKDRFNVPMRHGLWMKQGEPFEVGFNAP